MGSIVAKKRKNGSTGYSAQILVKRDGVIVHRETKTFDRRPAATAWLNRRETELAKPGGVEAAKVAKPREPTLAKAIDRYVDESEKAMGKTKAQVLRSIRNHAIASQPCSEVTSERLVSFLQDLTAKPQTRGNYLAHLGSVFAIARPAWGYQLDAQAIKDASLVAKKLGITSKSVQRERRPTIEEIGRILDHFTDRQTRRPAMNPMTKVVVFALFSTRRLEEILRITWADLDEAHSRVMVRDMKNPGEKVGNNVMCDLPPEAMRVVQSMPRIEDRIFPFGADAVGAAFTRATQVLGIDDLHFHDLRHEGVSRLFEMGGGIPQVAAVSGHRSWASLKRYTHMRQTGDKWADWRWFEVVTAGPYSSEANIVTMRRG